MSKCEICAHYKTAVCDFSGQPCRVKRVVSKPLGAPCEYVQREFTCERCGTHETEGAVVTSAAHGWMLCKDCYETG